MPKAQNGHRVSAFIVTDLFRCTVCQCACVRACMCMYISESRLFALYSFAYSLACLQNNGVDMDELLQLKRKKKEFEEVCVDVCSSMYVCMYVVCMFICMCGSVYSHVCICICTVFLCCFCTCLLC